MHLDGLLRGRLRPLSRAALLALALPAIACDRELPTSVGGELLPEANLVTYEILLPADSFLVADTAIAGFGSTARTTAALVANDHLGVLDAHGLMRFSAYPRTVPYRAAGDTIRIDSMPRYIGGELVVRLDTLGLGLDSLGTDTTIAFELYPIAESWDARTATWTVRSAELGDTLPWSTPGGTTGALLDTAVYMRSDTAGADSLVFSIDSATIAAWADSNDPSRGALLRTPDTGVFARVDVLRLRLFARPAARPDTVVTAATGVAEQTVIYDPEPAAPVAELRVGARWRSFLTFRDSLFDLTLPCPAGHAGCVVRLGDATVNRAQLLLTPVEVPDPFLPYSTMAVEARPVLGPVDLPLARAPIADTTGSVTGLDADTFDDPDGDRVSIAVTSLLMRLGATPDSAQNVRQRQLALVPVPEPNVFGFASFAGTGAGAEAPVLRLIVTVALPEEE